MKKSKAFEMNGEDWLKVLKGSMIACTGAAVDILSDMFLNLDYGEYTPVVYTTIPILVNLFRKWLTNNQK